MLYREIICLFPHSPCLHGVPRDNFTLPLASWSTQWWCSWLKHCAISRKVAGSIPDVVIGIFHWHNPSGHTMALDSTQPLTEMNTWNISCEVKTACAYYCESNDNCVHRLVKITEPSYGWRFLSWTAYIICSHLPHFNRAFVAKCL